MKRDDYIAADHTLPPVEQLGSPLVSGWEEGQIPVLIRARIIYAPGGGGGKTVKS